jgi:ABC-2 type transport system ATP-binding protein
MPRDDSDWAIRTRGLVKRYGRNQALRGLDLTVRRGEVFGFLGPNGAGKSTTIRILLDLIRPTAGDVRVLGQEPQAAGPQLRARIGYLPGELPPFGRETGRELLAFLGRLRGGVPPGRIDALAERLDANLTRQVRSLSKGNRQKLGIIQAFMHQPDLLILDEPTSGLDPLMQQVFLTMVREAREAGQTVFMSSHVLSEAQEAADRVGIIRAGELTTVAEVKSLMEQAPRRAEIRFEEPIDAHDFTAVPGVRDVQADSTTLTCKVDGRCDPFVKAIAKYTVNTMVVEEPDLEEIFLSEYAKEPSHDL